MTPAPRLRRTLTTLHWTGETLSRETGVSRRTVAHWLSGRYEPPERVLAWLERLAAYVAANPPPGRQDARAPVPGSDVPREAPDAV